MSATTFNRSWLLKCLISKMIFIWIMSAAPWMKHGFTT